MIKYRPHRGSLEDAMKEQQMFSDIAEMLKYIEDKSEGTIKAKNIVLSASLGEDERIEWKSVRNVLTTQYGSIKYSAPASAGVIWENLDNGTCNVLDPYKWEKICSN